MGYSAKVLTIEQKVLKSSKGKWSECWEAGNQRYCQAHHSICVCKEALEEMGTGALGRNMRHVDCVYFGHSSLVKDTPLLGCFGASRSMVVIAGHFKAYGQCAEFREADKARASRNIYGKNVL